MTQRRAVHQVPIKGADLMARVSPVDAHVERWTWRLDKDGYAYRSTSYRRPSDGSPVGYKVRLQRQVAGLERGDPREVHHRNEKILDCRRSNLVVVQKSDHLKAHQRAREVRLEHLVESGELEGEAVPVERMAAGGVVGD